MVSPSAEYDISGIELTDSQYTVIQNLVRNKYQALDAAGNTVLKGKQKLFKLKEEFPFTDGNGTDVFTVKASGIIDVAGDYVLADAQTGEELVILDNDFSVFHDNWTIRDSEIRAALAEITSRGALTTVARNLLPFGELIPHKYEITIDDANSVPREPVVAAAMVIDAIQGN